MSRRAPFPVRLAYAVAQDTVEFWSIVLTGVAKAVRRASQD